GAEAMRLLAECDDLWRVCHVNGKPTATSWLPRRVGMTAITSAKMRGLHLRVVRIYRLYRPTLRVRGDWRNATNLQQNRNPAVHCTRRVMRSFHLLSPACRGCPANTRPSHHHQSRWEHSWHTVGLLLGVCTQKSSSRHPWTLRNNWT